MLFLFRRDSAQTNGRAEAKSKGAPKRKSAASRPAAEAPVEAVADEAAQPIPMAQAGTSPMAPFALSAFPLLPLGKALFADEACRVEGLDRAVPQLPDCLIVLTAPAARGAVLVVEVVLAGTLAGPGGVEVA